jgi:hypothetical protein
LQSIDEIPVNKFVDGSREFIYGFFDDLMLLTATGKEPLES